jgi:hypothetical protein
LFEKSALVLEVHLIEAVTIEDGCLFVTVASGILTVVLWRRCQSSGACGRRDKVLALVFLGGCLRSGIRRSILEASPARSQQPSPSYYMVFLCWETVFWTLASLVIALVTVVLWVAFV